jgi:hypothetical protein
VAKASPCDGVEVEQVLPEGDLDGVLVQRSGGALLPRDGPPGGRRRRLLGVRRLLEPPAPEFEVLGRLPLLRRRTLLQREGAGAGADAAAGDLHDGHLLGLAHVLPHGGTCSRRRQAVGRWGGAGRSRVAATGKSRE